MLARLLKRSSLSFFFLLILPSCVNMGSPGSGGGIGTIPAFNIYSSCAVADLNGDGKLDIAVSYAVIQSAPPHPGVIAVFLQDPNHPGKFLAPSNYDVPNDPESVVIGDLNGDGKPDIAAVNTIATNDTQGSSSVSVLLQDPANPGKFFPAVNYATGYAPVAVAIGDVNQDGKADLVVSDSTGVSILLQNSTAPGKFLPPVTLPVSSGGTSGIAVADVNADGRADIIATSADVMVYIQNPAAPGTFAAPVHYAVGAQPYAIVVQDLNADGRPDLAIANLGSADGTVPASLSVLLQNSAAAGTFLPQTNYATDIRSWTIAAADLNADGKADLAVGNMGSYDGSSISIFLQDAVPGTFKLAKNYADSGNVSWVSAADMDGDGRQDLVIVSSAVEIRFQDPNNAGAFLDPVVIAQ